MTDSGYGEDAAASHGEEYEGKERRRSGYAQTPDRHRDQENEERRQRGSPRQHNRRRRSSVLLEHGVYIILPGSSQPVNFHIM